MFRDNFLCYIKNCIDIDTVGKHIQVYPNQKPWMTREVQQLLKERKTLKRGIHKAKSDYRRRIVDHLDSNNSRQVWQGITNYRTNLESAEGDASLCSFRG